MRETVLLFNIKDKKRAQELQMICMSLRIRVRLIKKEEYFQTVGVLAGMKEASETDRIYEGVSVRGCVSCQRNIRRSSSLLYMSCTEGRLFIRQSEDWAIRNRQKWLQFWKRVNMQSFLHLSMRQTRVRLLRYQLSVR